MQNYTPQKNMEIAKQDKSPRGFCSEVAKPRVMARKVLEIQTLSSVGQTLPLLS